MKIFLTFIFVAAIATLGVMNGNVQAADEQKAEAAVVAEAEVAAADAADAADAVAASTEEPTKAEHPAEHPKSEKHDHEAE